MQNLLTILVLLITVAPLLVAVVAATSTYRSIKYTQDIDSLKRRNESLLSELLRLHKLYGAKPGDKLVYRVPPEEQVLVIPNEDLRQAINAAVRKYNLEHGTNISELDSQGIPPLDVPSSTLPL